MSRLRAALAGLAFVLLAGCGQRGEVREFDGAGREIQPKNRIAVREGTPVIDQAAVLTPAEEQALARRGEAVAQRIGRKIAVVLVRPSGGQSVEQVAWAVSPGRRPDSALMLVIDADSAAMRVEGVGDVASSAAIARAMNASLREKRFAAGIAQGYDAIERLLGSPA